MHAPAPQPRDSTLTVLRGTLIANGEARMVKVDLQGHMQPNIVLHVRCNNASHNHVVVEQPFPPGAETRCRAAAKRFRKGMQVEFEAPIVWLSLYARRVTHIHIVTPEDTPE